MTSLSYIVTFNCDEIFPVMCHQHNMFLIDCVATADFLLLFLACLIFINVI